MTADRAALALEQVEGLEIFGGIALNRAVGGINPEAVRQSVAFDGGRGKVVWLPTFDAEFYVKRAGTGATYVSVMKNGNPVAELVEVFQIVAENNLILAMGHSAPEEVLVLIPFAKKQGVRQILVTHVFGQDATNLQMQQMADAGAMMELDWLAAYTNPELLKDYVEVIQSIGAEHFIISSDFGQAGNPDHATGMRQFIKALIEAGINQTQIQMMARNNPATLLGLGLVGVFLMENDFPLGPLILAFILGPIIESNFMRSILKSDGDLMAFVDRPIAMVLAGLAILTWTLIIANGVWKGRKAGKGGGVTTEAS